MAIQFTGMASGLDTNSIVNDLMKLEKTKVTAVRKEKTRLEMTKTAWSELNAKLYAFHKKELFAFKSEGTYNKKKVSSSNDGVISVSSSSQASNGVHSIEVTNMAKGSTVTGSKLADTVKKTTTAGTLGGFTGTATIRIKTGKNDSFGAGNEVTILDTDTIDEVIGKIKDLDLDINVNFDENYGTFFFSSKNSGKDVQLSITDNGNANGKSLLQGMGLTLTDNGGVGTVAGNDGEDASFKYNGATFTNATNNIAINGLNFNIKSSTGTAEIAVSTDTDAIYDSVKKFITKYNELLTEMTTKVQAKSARGYDPLTTDEKKAMSEEEIKLWDKKIKDSLLRNDNTLLGLKNQMRSTLSVSDGVDTSSLKYKFLSELGIVSGNYTENGILHIEGDADDALYAGRENRLRDAIENNLEGVTKFLTALGKEMYDNMYEGMASSSISSSLTFFNDKGMDTEMKNYDKKIAKLEARMKVVESRYYKQFTAMEKAIQQSNNTSNWLSQQLKSL